MKQKLIRLSQRYVTALRKHLMQGRRASLQPALGLGRRTVVLGLETLELAQEQERKQIRRDLQNEIASAQRLVVKSAQSVRRVPRAFSKL